MHLVRAGSRPIDRINPVGHQSRKCRMRPVANTLHITMLHGIKVQVIHMYGVIALVTKGMLPKAPLPDTALAPGTPYRRPALAGREASRKQCLDGAPTAGEIIITNRQCPDAMHVFRQHHPSINMKRMRAPHCAHRSAKALDFPHQEVVVPSFEQVHCEEIASTGDPETTIVRQDPSLFFSTILVYMYSGVPEHHGASASRPLVRRNEIAPYAG